MITALVFHIVIALILLPPSSLSPSIHLITFSTGKQLPSEKQGDSLVGLHVDAANSSRVTRHTFIGQQNIIKPSRYVFAVAIRWAHTLIGHCAPHGHP